MKVGLVINEWKGNTFDYVIRLPSTWVPSSSDPLLATDQEMSAQSMAQTLGMGHSYTNQFIPLQLWMDKFFITYTKQQHNYNSSLPQLLGINLQYQQFWSKEHEEDAFMG